MRDFDSLVRNVEKEMSRIRKEGENFAEESIGRYVAEATCVFIQGEIKAIENLIEQSFFTEEEGMDALEGTLFRRCFKAEQEMKTLKGVREIIAQLRKE